MLKKIFTLLSGMAGCKLNADPKHKAMSSFRDEEFIGYEAFQVSHGDPAEQGETEKKPG